MMVSIRARQAGAGLLLALTLVLGGSALQRSVAPTALAVAPSGSAARVAAPATIDDFFAAAALQQADVPDSLQPVEQGDLSPDMIAAQGIPGIADMLTSSGFLQGYQQGFAAADRGAVLNGGPAGVGDLITVFSSADGASAWNAFEQENAANVGQMAANSTGVSISLNGSTPLDLPAYGDESSAVELSGTATVAGLPVPVVVDIAFVRRGVVQYTIVAAAITSQADLLQQLTATLDAKVADALPLLNQ
jgi:hypothetical protein